MVFVSTNGDNRTVILALALLKFVTALDYLRVLKWFTELLNFEIPDDPNNPPTPFPPELHRDAQRGLRLPRLLRIDGRARAAPSPAPPLRPLSTRVRKNPRLQLDVGDDDVELEESEDEAARVDALVRRRDEERDESHGQRKLAAREEPDYEALRVRHGVPPSRIEPWVVIHDCEGALINASHIAFRHSCVMLCLYHILVAMTRRLTRMIQTTKGSTRKRKRATRAEAAELVTEVDEAMEELKLLITDVNSTNRQLQDCLRKLNSYLLKTPKLASRLYKCVGPNSWPDNFGAVAYYIITYWLPYAGNFVRRFTARWFTSGAVSSSIAESVNRRIKLAIPATHNLQHVSIPALYVHINLDVIESLNIARNEEPKAFDYHHRIKSQMKDAKLVITDYASKLVIAECARIMKLKPPALEDCDGMCPFKMSYRLPCCHAIVDGETFSLCDTDNMYIRPRIVAALSRELAIPQNPHIPDNLFLPGSNVEFAEDIAEGMVQAGMGHNEQLDER